MRERLRELAREAWEQHDRAERTLVLHLVRPSIPILFFGDSERFIGSALRVITVGLNPSREEFPRAAPFLRFPGSETLSSSDPNAYLASLDAYFRTAPYTTGSTPRSSRSSEASVRATTRPRRLSPCTRIFARRLRPTRPGRASAPTSRRCSSQAAGGCGTSL